MYHHRFESFVQPSSRDGLRPRLGRLSETLGLRLRSAASPAVSSPSRLPLEIAFLLDFGVPRIVLQQGARLARRHGVFADEALLAEGLVDEEVFYRALAERLGLRFLSRKSRSSADRTFAFAPSEAMRGSPERAEPGFARRRAQRRAVFWERRARRKRARVSRSPRARNFSMRRRAPRSIPSPARRLSARSAPRQSSARARRRRARPYPSPSP